MQLKRFPGFVIPRLALVLASSGALAAAPVPGWSQMTAAPSVAPAPTTPGLLSKDAVAPLVPPSVFFAGQVASTQARNAGAFRLPGGALVLATMVDTGGYSTSVKERYQAYLIAEAALTIDGHTLPAGAYGFGFLGGDRFLVMDIGGHDVFTAHSTQDPSLHRPTPLQMMTAPGGEGYRLYAGRSFITLRAAQ